MSSKRRLKRPHEESDYSGVSKTNRSRQSDVDREDEDPAKGIEYLRSSFQKNYGASAIFHVGTLKQAVNETFHPDSTEDARPLLICLSYEECPFENRFCRNIFCNEVVISYLRANYVVWAWDVTLAKNKARLRAWWREVFSDYELPNLYLKERSMLIRVMRCAPEEEMGFSPSEYQPQVLQHADLLVDTNAGSTLEDVLGTLRAFKEEWHRNEKLLASFDVCQATGLCPDVLVEIVQYLWLNDAVNAFSISILQLLHEAHTKVHLDNPSERFLQMISEHLDPSQIVSLHIRDCFRTSVCKTCFSANFDRLISLTLLNQKQWYTIRSFLSSLWSVRNLCLLYDDEFATHAFEALKYIPRDQITRLRVRCADVDSDSLSTGNVCRYDMKNNTITSFIFDTEYHPPHRNQSLARYRPSWSHLLKPVIKYIRSLVNVQRVRFITNRSRIKYLLHGKEWREAIRECVRLDRVILQLVDDGNFAREEHDIEQELQYSTRNNFSNRKTPSLIE